MIILLIISFIVGAVVTSVTGFELLGWVAGIVVFVVGLPGALIGGFIHGEVSYFADRADDRQIMSDLRADFRADEREHRADIRAEKLLSSSRKNRPTVIHDNRQVHIHERGKKK